MGIAAIFVTAPAAAAVAGLYFLDRRHANSNSNSKVVGDGLQTSKVDLWANMKKGAVQMPKLAPEFDGLNCFETVVGH